LVAELSVQTTFFGVKKLSIKAPDEPPCPPRRRRGGGGPHVVAKNFELPKAIWCTSPPIWAPPKATTQCNSNTGAIVAAMQ